MKKLIALIIFVTIILLSVFSYCQETKSQLATRFDVIRNETAVGGNTRQRIANAYQELSDGSIGVYPVTASGTDTYTGSLVGVDAYTGRIVFVVFPNDNTGASTLNLNSIGATNISKDDGTGSWVAIEAGDIQSGKLYRLYNDGTRWQIDVGTGGQDPLIPTNGTGTATTNVGADMDGWSLDITNAQNIGFQLTSDLKINSDPGTAGQVLTSSGSGSPPTWEDAAAGGVTDGDKGDITVSSSVWTIDNNVVTAAKLSSMSSSDLAGKISDETGTGALVFASGPALAGNPTAPTPSASDDDTSIATTEFVKDNALPAATSSNDGYLTSTDWSTFNNKQISLSQNVSNTLSMGGTWIATGNNQYHFDVNFQATGRATTSDNVLGLRHSYSLIAGANTQDLFGNSWSPTFNTGGFTGIDAVGLDYNPTLTGTFSTHVAAKFRLGAVLIGTATPTSGVDRGLQVNTAGTSDYGLLINNNSAQARFLVLGSGISNHIPTFTTSANNQSGIGSSGTITFRNTTSDRAFTWMNSSILTMTANNQTAVSFGVTGAYGDAASSGTSAIGFLFEPSSTTGVDAVYSFISANSAHRMGLGTATPTSTLQTASFAPAITTVTGNTTLDISHFTVIGNTTSGNVTITLPAASGCSGRVYIVKKSVAANTLSIDPNGSETIDGVSTNYDLTAQYTGLMIQSDGSNWMIIPGQ